MMPLRNFLLISVSFILLSVSCKKDNPQPVDELSKLTPATQYGANTFGCLVNGQALLLNGFSLFQNRIFQCSYTLVDNGFNLNFIAGHKNKDGSINSINIQTVDLQIEEGDTIALTDYNLKGKAYGAYDIYASTNEIYTTNEAVTGELHITKFDESKSIVSGTFWFDAVDQSGKKCRCATAGLIQFIIIDNNH